MEGVDWNAREYERNSGAQEDWGTRFHERLALRGDERIVDLGCGDGRLTARLASRVPRGRVLGLDASPSMVAHAREEHRGVPGLEFGLADARTFEVPFPADLVVSSSTLHWIRELDTVFDRTARSLAPKGRACFHMGGTGNVEDLESAARRVVERPAWSRWFRGFPEVWTMHSIEEAVDCARRAGLPVRRAELLERDMVHSDPDALLGWMRATWFLVAAAVPEERREDLLREFRDDYLADHPVDEQGRTHLRMVRLEVEAFRP